MTHRGEPPKPKPHRHAYDAAAIADNLKLPFDTPAFREVWVDYRTYREEQKMPRLTGGMQEAEALRQLANLARGSEAHALAIVKQTIGKGWKDFYKLDEQRQQPAHNVNQHAVYPRNNAANGPAARALHVPDVTDYGTL